MQNRDFELLLPERADLKATRKQILTASLEEPREEYKENSEVVEAKMSKGRCENKCELSRSKGQSRGDESVGGEVDLVR